MNRVALIAGTGTGDLFECGNWFEYQTQHGSAYLSTTGLGDHEILVIRRHGVDMRTPPHLINHRANIQALYENGVRRIFSTAAVGALDKSITPGTLALVSDFIDFTRRGPITVFDSPTLGPVHVDFSQPYCPEIYDALNHAAISAGIGPMRGVTYVGVDGPRYESPAEVRMFAKLGGHVVGMTAVPEIILSRELGICYGCLAIVANYAAGISDVPVAHDDVVSLVRKLQRQIYRILNDAICGISQIPNCDCASR